MTDQAKTPEGAGLLGLGIVLSASEQTCTLITQDRTAVLAYASFFPQPRMERVAPGHLVATAVAANGARVVVWRWFDAVVLGHEGRQVELWEPGHGQVSAQPRDPRRAHPPGSRAYASSGLEGAQWWLAGPAVPRAEDADVEVEEVQRFLSAHQLWDCLL